MNKTYSFNVQGRLHQFSNPIVMGILNITPDSFYDGGQYESTNKMISHAEKMLKEGATIIDLGAQSSRPSATFLDAETELKRLLPNLIALRKVFPELIISIDTFHSKVAQHCINEGADMINDISAGNMDTKMMEVVGRNNIPYVMMHMKGTPQTMIEHSHYDNISEDVSFYFSTKVEEAKAKGINNIIIDPGFGFAKNIQQNFELLNHIDQLSIFNSPILVGISRKSMIYKTLKIEPKDALNGTTVLNTIALIKGANILRVHDVKEAIETITLVAML